jgi:hypothetical protein
MAHAVATPADNGPISEAWPVDFTLVAEQFAEVAELSKPTCLAFIDAVIAEALRNLLTALAGYDGGEADALAECAEGLAACLYLPEPVRLHLGRRLKALPGAPSSARTLYPLVKAALNMVEHVLAGAYLGGVREELGTLVSAVEGLTDQLAGRAE